MNKKIISYIALLIPGILLAQNETDKTPDKTIDLSEVTIKAEKVSSKIQEVPVAASLVPAKKIETEKIEEVADLSAKIPNLVVLDYGSKFSPSLFIRGLGMRRDASTSVALYVDNIPYLQKSSLNFDFVDIANIEILRGPQGTLYGRNSMGGIIKVYTQDPKANFRSYIKADYGNYGQLKTYLNVNLPISKSFYSIFNAYYSRGDGFFTNNYDNSKADKYDLYAGRYKLSYRPNENTKAVLAVNYEHSEEMGYAYAAYNGNTQTSGDVNYNRPSSYNRDLFSVGVNLEQKMPGFTINASASYQLMEDHLDLDSDFSASDFFFINQDRKHHTFYLEANIHSKSDKKLKWLLGTTYFSQKANNDEIAFFGEDFTQMTQMPFDTYETVFTNNQPLSGFATYGQISVPLKKVELTLGARLDFEKIELEYTNQQIIPGIPAGDITAVNTNLKYNQFIPKASVAYKPCEYFTSFFTISKGFKAGGFNDPIDFPDDKTYNPEISWNYEFGIKSSWFNKQLIANLSLFYIEITDQQILKNKHVQDHNAYVTNAAKSDSKGFELDIIANINKDWQIFISYGLLGTRFLKGEYANNLLPFIPNYTFNIGSNYNLKLNSGFIKNIQFNLNYQHIGNQYWDEANTAMQKAYGLTNGRISLESKNIELGVWAKNIFDIDYHAFYFTSLGQAYVQIGKPAQFGVFAKFTIK